MFKKSITFTLIILTLMVLIFGLSSCNDNRVVIRHDNGQKIILDDYNRIYSIGDTVYVEYSTNLNTGYNWNSISKLYWCDTITLTQIDSFRITSIYKKGIVIK